MRLAHLSGSDGRFRYWHFATTVAILALAGTAVPGTHADTPEPTAVAQNASPAGALLRWQPASKKWEVVPPKAELPVGAWLTVLPGDRGRVTGGRGAVRLSLWGNVPQVSPDPLRDCTLLLDKAASADLAFTIRHGRAVVTNARERGAAHVRLKFNDQSYGVSLEPGTEMAIEHYSRWPRGVPFVVQKPGSKTDADQARPLVTVVLLVLKGRADVDTGQGQFAMLAPPGPAGFAWDNFRGPQSGPYRVNAIPEWAKATKPASAENKKVTQAVHQIRQAIAEKPIHEVLTDALSSDDEVLRDLAVDDMAAVNDLGGVMQALNDKTHPDVRQTAVEALRHWIGRGTAEDQRFYQYLVKERHYTPARAQIMLQLLHSFDRDAWYQPETYDLLIGYLNNPHMAIRVLAASHLYRSPFAPAGGDRIAYDPAGTDEERSRAVTQWRKLIPEGTIPRELRKKRPN